MIVAHAAGSSGPHPEFLVVAGALLVLGVLFYIRKAVKPIVSVVLVVLAIALGSGAFIIEADSASARSIVITEPKPGDTVRAGEPIRVQVAVDGGSLAGESDDPNAGHLHIEVDGELIAMPSTREPKISFAPGRHTLTAEYVDGRHQSFEPEVRDEIELKAR